jgi:hypothetical protein
VDSLKNLAEAPFAKQHIHLVLSQNLLHFELSALRLQVKLVVILNEMNIVLCQAEPCQVVQSAVPRVRHLHFFAKSLQQRLHAFEVLDVH